MPTKREREDNRMGFRDGQRIVSEDLGDPFTARGIPFSTVSSEGRYGDVIAERGRRKPKRKLSAWNKFVKANSRKKEFRYRDGKLNLKKMGVAFRRKKRR